MNELLINAVGPLREWFYSLGELGPAIWIVLKTSLGERVMLPSFGAGVDGFVFQPNSAATRAALVQSIRTALVRWEPRIELVAVRVDPVPGEASQVICAVEYRLRATNELFNVVLPFFLSEGVS